MDPQNTVVVVSPLPLFPINSGNKIRMLELVRFLADEAICQLVFVQYGGVDSVMYTKTGKNIPIRTIAGVYSQNAQIDGLPFASIFRKMNVLVDVLKHRGQLRPSVLREPVKVIAQQIAEIAKEYDARIIQYEYAYWHNIASATQKLYKAKTICDTHDILSRRKKFKIQRLGFPRIYCPTEQEEQLMLSAFDSIVAIQENERRILKEWGFENSNVLGHLFQLSPIPKKFCCDMTIGFVGSANPYNIAAAKLLQNTIFPRIQRALPDTKLVFAGEVCNHLSPPENQSTQLLGRIEDLALFYNQVSMVINMVSEGTGLKIKNVEALAHGIPVVSTQVGVEGLESYVSIALRSANSVDEAVEFSVQMLRSEDSYSAACDAAVSIAGAIFENSKRAMLQIYNTK